MIREIRKMTPINHKTVQRLMKELGLHCMVLRKKFRAYKGAEGKIAPNVLKRDFNAMVPNEKWVTDVTDSTCIDKRYICFQLWIYITVKSSAIPFFRRPTLSMLSEKGVTQSMSRRGNCLDNSVVENSLES
ncbi:uncharacterized transposase-like protein (plasmid) [Paenibacillus polymyxa M1]|nr:uncharacterized transposase-like protein [Paenibacillus polymyxa M1]